MKIFINLAFFLMPILCFANPAPFGLEIGHMTLKEFKEMEQGHFEGINKWSKGETYSLSPKEIQFEGLEKVLVLFDKDEKLVAVTAILQKTSFNCVLKMLQDKYTLIDKNIPFVSEKFAVFSDAEVQIELDAPHIGFEMKITYALKKFLSQYENETAEILHNIEKEAPKL